MFSLCHSDCLDLDLDLDLDLEYRLFLRSRRSQNLMRHSLEIGRSQISGLPKTARSRPPVYSQLICDVTLFFFMKENIAVDLDVL